MVTLSPADVAIILVYFVAVLVIGYRSARKTTPAQEDYLLAGRSLTLPLFVMTLVSTWYGGILGVGEFTYRYGISNWLVMGVPYYVFAALFAALLAKRIRATNLFSIPDKLHFAYDRKTAVLGSVLTFVLTSPAPYLLMLSVFLQMLFGLSLSVSILVATVVTLSYLYTGGFGSDVATDVFEFFFMFLGFGVVLPFALSRFGGGDFLREHLPPLHLTLSGGHSLQYIAVWFFIALWTLVDPAFHQRCYAARDGKTAQRGILISILFWLVFDFMTVTAGLYARAILPDLDEPMESYPRLAETILPPVAKGIFYVGMLATIMSTLNTLGFVSAQTLGRDIILRLKGEIPHADAGSAGAVRYTKLGLVVTSLVSAAFALAVPSVVGLWYAIGTVAIPGLLVPLIASYFEQLNIPPRHAFLSMLLGWLTSLAWFMLGHVGGEPEVYPFGIEPMYPGLGVSLILWMLGRRARHR